MRERQTPHGEADRSVRAVASFDAFDGHEPRNPIQGAPGGGGQEAASRRAGGCRSSDSREDPPALVIRFMGEDQVLGGGIAEMRIR